MITSTRLAPILAVLAVLGAGTAGRATTSLTVHNQTGRTLAVTRPWSPWRPEPGYLPRDLHGSSRWLRPGATATYCFLVPGKDLESDLVVRRLPPDGLIEFEGLTIQVADPEPRAMGEEVSPEPEAAAVRTENPG